MGSRISYQKLQSLWGCESIACRIMPNTMWQSKIVKSSSPDNFPNCLFSLFSSGISQPRLITRAKMLRWSPYVDRSILKKNMSGVWIGHSTCIPWDPQWNLLTFHQKKGWRRSYGHEPLQRISDLEHWWPSSEVLKPFARLAWYCGGVCWRRGEGGRMIQCLNYLKSTAPSHHVPGVKSASLEVLKRSYIIIYIKYIMFLFVLLYYILFLFYFTLLYAIKFTLFFN